MVFRDDLRRDVWARSEQALVRRDGRLFQIVRVEMSHLAPPGGARRLLRRREGPPRPQARLQRPRIPHPGGRPGAPRHDRSRPRRRVRPARRAHGQAGRAAGDLAPPPLPRRHRLLRPAARRREEPLAVFPGGDRARGEDGRIPRGRALQVEHRAGLGRRDLFPPGRRSRQGGLRRRLAPGIDRAPGDAGRRPDRALPSRGALPPDLVRPRPRAARRDARGFGHGHRHPRPVLVLRPGPGPGRDQVRLERTELHAEPVRRRGPDRLGAQGLGRQAVLLASRRRAARGSSSGWPAGATPGSTASTWAPSPKPRPTGSSSTWTSSPRRAIRTRWSRCGTRSAATTARRTRTSPTASGAGTRSTPRPGSSSPRRPRCSPNSNAGTATAIPEVRGDFTGYWEDGAASTARETAMSRAAAGRLVQAEALWSILGRDGFPAAKDDEAWRAGRPVQRAHVGRLRQRLGSGRRRAAGPMGVQEGLRGRGGADVPRASRGSVGRRRRGPRPGAGGERRRRRQHVLVGADRPRPRSRPDERRRGPRPGGRRRGRALAAASHGRAGVPRVGGAGLRGQALYDPRGSGLEGGPSRDRRRRGLERGHRRDRRTRDGRHRESPLEERLIARPRARRPRARARPGPLSLRPGARPESGPDRLRGRDQAGRAGPSRRVAHRRVGRAGSEGTRPRIPGRRRPAAPRDRRDRRQGKGPGQRGRPHRLPLRRARRHGLGSTSAGVSSVRRPTRSPGPAATSSAPATASISRTGSSA